MRGAATLASEAQQHASRLTGGTPDENPGMRAWWVVQGGIHGVATFGNHAIAYRPLR